MRASQVAGAVILAAVASCGGGPKLSKLPADAVILAFGDSLTYGTGAGPADSYPARLQASARRKVENAGIPGETSAEGLERLAATLDEVRPALLILCHGGNDFLRRLDEAKTAANLRAMIKLARARSIPVVLVATPKATFPPAVPDFYRTIATENALPLEEGALRAVLFDNRLKSDLVHPNAEGYAQIAGAIEKLLRRSGAL